MNITNAIQKTNTSLLKSPDGAKAKSAEEKDAELKKACAAFEGMFLEMMMKTMRKSITESSLIKKNNGEKIFTDMLDQAYVDELVKTPKTGVGESLYRFIKETSPDYKDNAKGNNFPNKLLNSYDAAKIRSQGLAESRLDLLK